MACVGLLLLAQASVNAWLLAHGEGMLFECPSQFSSRLRMLTACGCLAVWHQGDPYVHGKSIDYFLFAT